MKRNVSKALSFIMSVCITVATFANGAIQRVYADSTVTIVNSTFEDGSTTGWTPRGSAQLSATTEAAASGTHSMKVTGRNDNWTGPSMDLKNKLVKGETYNFSFKAKVVKGQASSDAADTNQLLSLTMLRRDSTASSDSYDSIAYQKTVNEESWTTITGTYVPTFDSYTTLTLYIESSNPTLQFYIDDVVITGPSKDAEIPPKNPNAPPVGTNLISNGTFEDGTASGWSGRGTAQLTATTEDKASGNYSLKVTGRTDTWNGPSVHLIDKVNLGSTYSVSLKAKAVPGQTGTKTVTISTEKTTDGSQSWGNLKSNVAINDSTWTTIDAEMSLAGATSSLTELDVYVESSNVNLEFYIDDVSIVEEANSAPLPVQMNIPSLKDAFKDYFTVGGAVVPETIAAGSLSEQLVSKHYAMIVPGNQMKPDAIQKTEGVFNFDEGDKIVDYAIAHNMTMRGHTLVWHSQIPDWFFQDPSDPSKPASKELLLQREKTHITTVLNHFKTKYGASNPIKYWDVVNEVIGDDGNYRDSKWYQIAGPDYIKTAFEAARAADPSMKLVINDYNIENNGAKTEKFYEVVKELLAAGVPVDAIGMQMHLSTSTSMEAVKASIEKLATLGLEIQITELDMTIADTPITQAGFEKQARLYKQFFDILKSKKQYIHTVMFWGVTDADSWRTESKPLIFDGQFQAKASYWSIIDPSKAAVDRQSCQASQGTPANVSDSAWSTAKSISANTFVKGLNGATAKVQTMWDDKNLYVKAYVNDSTVGSKDSLEIFVDKKADKASAYVPDENHKHLTVNRSNADSTEYGYTAYLTIPISDINPTQDKLLGFDVRVNDDQKTGNIDTIAVYNDYVNRQDKNAAFFADLKLGSASKLAKAAYGTPSIDGTIDSIWNTSDVMNTDIWVAGSSGATAKARALWDDKNLYVIAEVTDDVLNKDNANAWEQDSVEVFLDQTNGKTASYDGDDSQIRVNFENAQSFGGKTPEGFKSATVKTATGYIVEEAIPLTAVTPAAGKILGFDVQVNNADVSGTRTSVATWCDTSGTGYQNTSGFGNLLLVDTRIVHVTGVTLNKSDVTINKGDALQLTATVDPTNASNANLTWSSDNSAVASVDANGKVTALSVGKANITVTTIDGSKTAVCTISVAEPSSSLPSDTNTTGNLPKTGSMVDFNTLLILGSALLASGIMLIKKKRTE